MNNTFITRLKGSVSDNSILKLGEIRIGIDSIKDNIALKIVSINNDGIMEIIGDGYFTDKSFVENLGKRIKYSDLKSHIAYFSKGTYDVALLDKYSISSIEIQSTNTNIGVSFDVSILKYLSSLKTLNLTNTLVSGDIGDLSYLPSLETLNLTNTLVSGDIGDLSNLPSLETLNLTNTLVSGDIGDLSNLPSLEKAYLKGSNYSGDLSKMPSMLSFISFKYDKGSRLTWKNRDTKYPIMSIEGTAFLDNVDAMLINQSNCAESNETLKIIEVNGTRTSASDAAVATLQSKGYTVSITPA